MAISSCTEVYHSKLNWGFIVLWLVCIPAFLLTASFGFPFGKLSLSTMRVLVGRKFRCFPFNICSWRSLPTPFPGQAGECILMLANLRASPKTLTSVWVKQGHRKCLEFNHLSLQQLPDQIISTKRLFPGFSLSSFSELLSLYPILSLDLQTFCKFWRPNPANKLPSTGSQRLFQLLLTKKSWYSKPTTGQV